MGRGIIGYLIFIALIYFLQYVLGVVLTAIGLHALAVFLIIEFVISVIFAYLIYPAPYRKEAYKDPRFHMNIAIFFTVFIILRFIF